MIVLFGAGTTGRVIARDLNVKGTPAECFVDNDPKKGGLLMEGLPVHNPELAMALYPDATWIVSVVRPERHEIIAQIEAMGVKTMPMWEFVPKRYNLPPTSARMTVETLIHDKESLDFWNDQIAFRSYPESYKQITQSNIDNIYFESFISRRDDENFVDCGAADGDTIKDFSARWNNWSRITAFEPDIANYHKLAAVEVHDLHLYQNIVSDRAGMLRFTSTADYSSHVDSNGMDAIFAVSLDEIRMPPPTFIKMDIEGSELQALWGARQILKDHFPVLAICAYHEAEHLWEIPLLIHALQPEYNFFLRRYAESTFELVWYAIPKERVR